MFRFLPWKAIVRRAARSYGISDPALWLARIRSFSQPSEIQEPIELLRAGIHFHARGLINTKAIQHNLDWIWPYWVERQFDPADSAFIPRAFSFSHINLTHRNWTAIGLPELAVYPIVDPRGLVTPLYDGWSLDFWLIDSTGQQLLPSRIHDQECDQTLSSTGELAVQTTLWESDLRLRQWTEVVVEANQPVLQIGVSVLCPMGGTLALAIRPYNPEGIQFIDGVEALPDRSGWIVNGNTSVLTDRLADRMLTSHYDTGDLLTRVRTGDDRPIDTELREVCDQGMATAASLFDFRDSEFQLTVRVPLERELKAVGHPKTFQPSVTWASVTADTAALSVPDGRLQRLYRSAVRTLVLLSVDEIVPGPYTYRRFWFRDACLMMNPLMAIGFSDRCERMIKRLPERQQRDGYFRSQDGEWDSNGQVLWILNRFRKISRRPLSPAVIQILDGAVNWLDRKRVRSDRGGRHSGLLPAGFSAEHLGPNDFYYWDDFWAEAGLRAVAEIWNELGLFTKSARAARLADEFHVAVQKSLAQLPDSQTGGGIPASPYRRMDTGAIGSLVADYPLQLTPPNDKRITATVDALLDRHFFRGGFFQDTIHSGINAYLTLDIAQTLLRNGDARWRDLFDAVADLASPTGQWPEAIHPRTLGGCMGDGQHGWAAAEWVMMIRNCFVREEADRLIVGSGVFPEWLRQDMELAFGPTWTPWGRLTVRIVQPKSSPTLVLEAQWHGPAPRIDICIPGFETIFGAVGTSIALQAIVTQESRGANMARPETATAERRES
jgi:hypothetical protein